MTKITPEKYGEYTAFPSPHGYFDEFEFPKFVREAEKTGADIAFCGTIRILPDGSLSRAYHTDESLHLSGKEAYELMVQEQWIPPRLFGTLIRCKIYSKIDFGRDSEQSQVLDLVMNAEKVFIYGGYAAYLDCRYDISSIHSESSAWLSENPSKTAFRKPFENLPPRSHHRRTWILGAPEHANLGDQAIVYAMKQFVRAVSPDTDIIEIGESQLAEQIEQLIHAVAPQDLILLVGGGNLGDLYPGPERARRIAIESFPVNPMILFPQSVCFQDPDALSQAQILLASHANLTLCARERFSFEQMKAYFPTNHVLLVPDVVLSIKPEVREEKRKGAILLIRLDRESALSAEAIAGLRALLSGRFGEVTLGDTIVRHKCRDREEELNKKLQQLRGAELVITDRLHGAIFASLTQTPCILLPNNYHKVEGTFEWLKRVPTISLCRDISRFCAIAEELAAEPPIRTECDFFSNEFEELKCLLKGSLK